MLAMTSLDLNQQRVLIREDLNVPMKAGSITNTKRIEAALPTIQYALAQNAAVILISHCGRPTEGVFDPTFSLQPVADKLSEKLGQSIKLVRDWNENIAVAPGECILLENCRFWPGEKTNNDQLAQQLAALCDIFVMDAFATAHRTHASTTGLSKYAKIACAGPLLLKEIQHLDQAIARAESPVVAIVGGAKVSSKLCLLENLINKVDHLIVVGGIANTFLAAKGYNVGQSLVEQELIDTAVSLLKKVEKKQISLPLPHDVVVADCINATKGIIKPLDNMANSDAIFDIGPQTIEQYCQLIKQAQTIIWNGPVGVFENPSFAAGTKAISQAVAESQAFSLAGGGDTIAAIDEFQIQKQISYISTGGGAFLEYLEGKILPAIAALHS